MDIFPTTKQRAALLKLTKALVSRDSTLRRDECGDWRIEGSSGHVYAVPGTLDQPNRPGFMLYIMTSSPKAWTFAKRALAFAKVINDGDEEGVCHGSPADGRRGRIDPALLRHLEEARGQRSRA
jgi:hypothetical protein